MTITLAKTDPGMVDAIRQYLTDMSRMRDAAGAGDGFERLIAEQGFASTERLDAVAMGYPAMEMKQCYFNSATSLMDHELDPSEWFYCEGYGLRTGLPLCFEHAWLVNREGQVIDRTWTTDRDGPDAYFGIPFQWKYALGRMTETEYPSVLMGNGFQPNLNLLTADPATYRAFVEVPA